MQHKDQHFPLIEYTIGDSYLQWGQQHGETYADAINDLCQTRKDLMLQKNPALKENLVKLAQLQLQVTKDFSLDLYNELKGISEGSNQEIEDIVILNNYTDFRDIILPDEGCSTIYSQTASGNLAGQTWDMHSSAKKYVSVMKVPNKSGEFDILFSLVGCLGMMGVNSHGLFIGVNNVNTLNAKAGLIWPALVRKTLEQETLTDMREVLTNAPVTSGHNYLIADKDNAEHWEISPDFKDCVLKSSEDKHIYHTNHCLTDKADLYEDKNSISSTTHARHDLLDKNVEKVTDFVSFTNLLKSHEGFPKSICSHFESGAQDPSMTCGGATYNFQTKDFHLWRGCKEYDDNYVEYNLKV